MTIIKSDLLVPLNYIHRSDNTLPQSPRMVNNNRQAIPTYKAFLSGHIITVAIIILYIAIVAVNFFSPEQ